MAGKKDDEIENLLQIIHRQQEVLNSLGKRSEEEERENAALDEECERQSAWLEAPGWRNLWDEDAKAYVVPETGWPAGYVRKPKDAPKPDTQVVEERESEPDTLMHRMLKKHKNGFGGG